MNTKITKYKIWTLFNNICHTLSPEEINKNRTNIYKKEAIYNILSEKDKLKSKESKILNRITTYFNKMHEDLSKKNKYQENTIYGLDLLFNDDYYYKPMEIKRAFNGNYILYESNGDKDALLSIPEYFIKIKPYLRDFIDFYNRFGKWKIQLSMHITFISFTDTTERQIMHSKSDNAESMRRCWYEELIDTFMQRYQEGLETKMKDSSYIFDHVNLLEYHFHKISLNRGSSYIPSADWLYNKKLLLTL